MQCTRVIAIGCLLLMPSPTLAQVVERTGVESSGRGAPVAGERRGEPLLDQARRLATPPANDWSRSRVQSTPLMTARDVGQPSGTGQAGSLQEKRTVRRRILGAIVGATGGFFAGAYTGAWVEGDSCQCDAAGLKGAVIGGTTGAAAGGTDAFQSSADVMFRLWLNVDRDAIRAGLDETGRVMIGVFDH